MRESKILQIDHHVQINDAVLVKIQIRLASYLKRQGCENNKENTYVEQYIKELFFTLNTLEQTKLSK